MPPQPDGGPSASTASGVAGQWRQLCAEFVAVWAQVMKEASEAPASRAAAIYATGAQRLGLMLAKVPEMAVAPGGWFDAALRACAAAAPPEAAGAVATLARALTHYQTVLAAFALAERTVLLRGCAAFGQRVAAVAPADRQLRTYLRLWIDAIDEAHATATRDARYVREHAAVINALIDVTLALRSAGQRYVRAFDLPVREEVRALEARIGELERRLATHGTARAAPPVQAKPKRRVKPAAAIKPAAAKARRRAKVRR